MPARRRRAEANVVLNDEEHRLHVNGNKGLTTENPKTPMKKTLLITTIICGMMAAGTAFSQHTQSMQFVPSGSIFNQNDTFTVDTFLTFSGYSALPSPFGWKRLSGRRVFSTSRQNSISCSMATRGQVSSFVVTATALRTVIWVADRRHLSRPAR